MNTCATCKWWRRTPKDDPESEVVDGYGWCDRFRIGLNDHRRFLKPYSPLVYPVTKNTDVATHDTFGCTLHEPKDPTG